MGPRASLDVYGEEKKNLIPFWMRTTDRPAPSVFATLITPVSALYICMRICKYAAIACIYMPLRKQILPLCTYLRVN